MNIVIATGLYAPEIGGPATHTQLLETHLSKKDFTVTVVAFSKVKKFPKTIRHIVYIYLLLKERKKMDLLYALDPVSVGVPAYIASRILGKKFVLRIAGDYAWEQGQVRFGVTEVLDDFVLQTEKYHPIVRLLKKVQMHVALHADSVIVPSKYLKSIIKKWGVPVHNVHVIYSVFLPHEVKGSKDELRMKYGYTGTVVVSVGRLVPWKGFMQLTEVVATMYKKNKGISLKLVIIGDGPQRIALEKCAKDLGISEHVTYTGSLPQKVVHEMVKAGDLFVLNTAYEGFSHQLLETMHMDTPIVTTLAGGNPELITDKVEGLLVNVNDAKSLEEAMEQILHDKTLKTRLVSNAHTKVQVFSVERMIDDISAVFHTYG